MKIMLVKMRPWRMWPEVQLDGNDLDIFIERRNPCGAFE